MKELLKKIKLKIINFCKWIWSEVKDWHNLVILAVVAVLVFGLGVLGVQLVAYFTGKDWHFMASVTIVTAFWVGPFTPFWPLCIAITLFIRKLIEKIWLPKHNNNNNNNKNK